MLFSISSKQSWTINGLFNAFTHAFYVASLNIIPTCMKCPVVKSLDKLTINLNPVGFSSTLDLSLTQQLHSADFISILLKSTNNAKLLFTYRFHPCITYRPWSVGWLSIIPLKICSFCGCPVSTGAL